MADEAPETPQKPTRSVQDFILISFAIVIAFEFIISTVVLLIVKIKDPHADTDAIATLLQTQTSLILGALLGYATGRYTKMNGS